MSTVATARLDLQCRQRSHRSLGVLLFLLFSTTVVVACRGPEAVPVAKAQPELVSVERLLESPTSYTRGPLRVAGWCRIEFEGNALYSTKEALERGTEKGAIWLALGWPVSPDTRELDGTPIIVEGRFNINTKGHGGAFAGALEDIQRITRSTPD
jgi:hypothetical protein